MLRLPVEVRQLIFSKCHWRALCELQAVRRSWLGELISEWRRRSILLRPTLQPALDRGLLVPSWRRFFRGTPRCHHMTAIGPP